MDTKRSRHPQFTANPQPDYSLLDKVDPNRLVRLPEVLRLIPVARSTWLAWVASCKAPAPVRLGRCTCWRYGDLLTWIEQAKTEGRRP